MNSQKRVPSESFRPAAVGRSSAVRTAMLAALLAVVPARAEKPERPSPAQPRETAAAADDKLSPEQERALVERAERCFGAFMRESRKFPDGEPIVFNYEDPSGIVHRDCFFDTRGFFLSCDGKEYPVKFPFPARVRLSDVTSSEKGLSGTVVMRTLLIASAKLQGTLHPKDVLRGLDKLYLRGPRNPSADSIVAAVGFPKKTVK